MQNITQTVRFPVSSVVPSKLPDDVQALLLKTRQAKRTLDGIPEKAPSADYFIAHKALVEELNDLAGPKILKEVAAFGATCLSDDVNVNMQLGTMLFDIYTRLSPEPQAPLAKLIWRKKSMELAEVFDADEFNLPDYATGMIKRALMDESVWQSLSLSVWVDLPLSAKRYYFTVNSQGVVYFSKVLEAAAELVYSEDLKDAK